jgi:hypothetical protein
MFLLKDIIRNLKESFNKEFKLFQNEKNAILQKFNNMKENIEHTKELLGGNVHVDNYTYAVNPHEDNDWINKVEDGDIKIPKYFSKEEKRRMEEEKAEQERRLKELSGDSCKNLILTFSPNERVKLYD